MTMNDYTSERANNLAGERTQTEAAELYAVLDRVAAVDVRLMRDVEAAVNAYVGASIEAAFGLGWQAHADPAPWLFAE